MLRPIRIFFHKNLTRTTKGPDASDEITIKRTLINELNELKKLIADNESLNQYFTGEVDAMLEEANTYLKSIMNSDDKLSEAERFISSSKENINLLILSTKEKEQDKFTLINRTEQFLENLKTYIDKNSFFPTPMLFEANRLEGKLQDLKDSNPMQVQNSIDLLDKKLSELSHSFETFLKLNEDINSLINSNQNMSGNDKQHLFFLVQKSKFEEAERELLKYKKAEG